MCQSDHAPDWAISEKLADTLRRELARLTQLGPAPVRTLETGSGWSTEIFRAAGCDHLALEHDRAYADKNGAAHRPLDPATKWYSLAEADLAQVLDLILIDGPPQNLGDRHGMLPHLSRLAGPETTIIVDDVQRPRDMNLADAIRRRLQRSIEFGAELGRRWAILRPPAGVPGWAVAVTAAPRPHGSTLAGTVDSLAAAGFPAPIVFAEPGADTDAVLGKALVAPNREPLGAWNNWLHALRTLVEAHPEAHAFLLVQDDVQVCRGLRDYLSKTLWPEPVEKIAVCSAYTCGQNRAVNRGWHNRTDGQHTVGALLWTIPPAAARRILSELSDKYPKSPEEKRIDMRVGRWARNRGLHIWNHTPSLAQHTGRGNSSLGDGSTSTLRRATDFPGPDFCPQPFCIARQTS